MSFSRLGSYLHSKFVGGVRSMLSLLRGCMDFPGLDHSVSDKRYFIAKVHDDRSDWDLLYHLAKTHV